MSKKVIFPLIPFKYILESWSTVVIWHSFNIIPRM
uniref:Uncharacterized protein n=1 Tax=Anguilla anguilla TaxID=7936 RepID=A0A0E9VAE7_ANGAN